MWVSEKEFPINGLDILRFLWQSYVRIAFAGCRTRFMVSRMDNPTWVLVSFGSPASLTAWWMRCRPSKSMETKTTLSLLISTTEGISRGSLGRGPSPKKYCRSSWGVLVTFCAANREMLENLDLQQLWATRYKWSLGWIDFWNFKCLILIYFSTVKYTTDKSAQRVRLTRIWCLQFE